MNTLISFASRRSAVAAARGGVLRSVCVSLIAGLGFAGIASAGFVTVPNGDFSGLGNAGSVGGGLVGASGTNVPIGSGPWTATYNGVLGLLAPPTLAISPSQKTATISGLLGVNAVTMAIDYSRRQIVEATAWEQVSRSADYAEPYPAQYPVDE